MPLAEHLELGRELSCGYFRHYGVELSPNEAICADLLEREEAVTYDRFIAALWTYFPPADPEMCVRATIKRLRKKLPGLGIVNMATVGYRTARRRKTAALKVIV